MLFSLVPQDREVSRGEYLCVCCQCIIDASLASTNHRANKATILNLHTSNRLNLKWRTSSRFCCFQMRNMCVGWQRHWTQELWESWGLWSGMQFCCHYKRCQVLTRKLIPHSWRKSLSSKWFYFQENIMTGWKRMCNHSVVHWRITNYT